MQTPIPNPWDSLECIPGLNAVPFIWQRRMGQYFPAFLGLCLQPSQILAEQYPCPCPAECGCWHRVIHRHPNGSPPLTHQSQQSSSTSSFSFSSSIPSDSTNPPEGPAAIGVCCCEPPHCHDIPLTIADITGLEVSLPRLARGLCKTFGLTSKFARLTPPDTIQFGSWSADAIPAILTIHVYHSTFRSAVTELVASLNSPFLLFAPTADYFDAHTQAHLARVHAGFFALDSTVIITDQGAFLPARPPGELFAQFTPQPRELDQDLATRVVALVSQFDADTLTIFRLYCIEALSAAQIARRCHSSKTAVIRRLAIIRQKTGIAPAQMRKLSPHLAKIQDVLADPRAAHIRPKRLIQDSPATRDSDLG